MIYLAIQTLLFLVVSVVLGLVFGWWLKSAFFVRARAADVAVIDGLRAELTDARQEHDAQVTEMTSLRERLARSEQACATKQTELDALRETLSQTQEERDQRR